MGFGGSTLSGTPAYPEEVQKALDNMQELISGYPGVEDVLGADTLKQIADFSSGFIRDVLDGKIQIKNSENIEKYPGVVLRPHLDEFMTQKINPIIAPLDDEDEIPFDGIVRRVISQTLHNFISQELEAGTLRGTFNNPGVSEERAPSLENSSSSAPTAQP